MRDYDKITDWVIYKITSPSGRVYVGKTSNFKRRISQYRCLACVCQWVLLRSFKKYGFENHIIEVIEEFNSDIKYADGKEMMWIRSLMTNFSKGVKFQGTSEERKRKFGSHNIGHTRNRGRKQSAEIIAAKVLQKIGKPLFKKWEKVSQFDMNHTFIQTFPSIKEAADTLKLNSGKISAVVNGKRKTTGNYIFKFAA